MKSIYIFVIIGIIVGGVVWFNLPPKEVSAPIISDTQVVPSTEVTPTQANDMGMTPEEHAAMMGNSTQGTDVGMEMPMADTPQTNQGVSNAPSEKTFMVHGTNFVFDVKEIKVKKGDKVTIHFMSMDGFHDVVIDEFNAKTERIKTGGMAMMTFVADKTGTFEYYCSVGSHRLNGMVGKLIVE